MIKSFRHKGLEAFFDTGTKKGIDPNHAEKLFRMLDRLATAKAPSDMNLPAYGLHELQGKRRGTWAADVSGNWRLTFKFENENVVSVDYEDYH